MPDNPPRALRTVPTIRLRVPGGAVVGGVLGDAVGGTPGAIAGAGGAYLGNQASKR